MVRLPKEESIHYPFLLFIVMLGICVVREPSLVLLGMGRSSIWVFIPCTISIWLGIWLHQKTVRQEHMSFMAIARSVGGVLFERGLYMLYMILFLGGAFYYTYLSGDFISKTLLSGNVRSFVLLEAVLATLIALFPLKALARYAHIMMIFVVPFFILISLSPLLHIRWHWVMPVFAMQDIRNPLNSFCSAMLTFMPIGAIALIQDNKRTVSGISVALLSALAALITTYFVVASIATFGVHRAREIIYLTYSLINAVRIENFVLERNVFIWILYWKFMQFVGCAFFIRCAARAAAGMFGVRTRAILILALGFAVGIAEWLAASPFIGTNLSVPLGLYTFVITVFVPILLYLLLKLRRKPV